MVCLAKCLAISLLLILGNVQVNAEDSEFDKFLKGQSYDKKKLLEQSAEQDDNSGGFNAPSDAIPLFETSSIALILPLDAPGYLGEVANAYLEGFISSAESEGEQFALETYRTDGRPNSDLQAYRQAINEGAGMVVGPLLRSSVELITQLPSSFIVPTLLLQNPEKSIHAGQPGAPLLYTFPLGAEPEIIQFATDITYINELDDPLARREVFVLAENTKLGDSLINTFNRAWVLTGNAPARVVKIVSPDSWVVLHNQLRALLTDKEAEEKLKTKEESNAGKMNALYKEKVIPVIFAAGDSEFAGQARANVPSALPVYVLSAFKSDLDRSGRNLLGLSGIRMFEMPYVLNLKERSKDVIAQDFAYGQTVDIQRYIAAGIDSFKIVKDFPNWAAFNLWNLDGATGRIVLDDGRFLRQGVTLEIIDGVIKTVDRTPPVEECIENTDDCKL